MIRLLKGIETERPARIHDYHEETTVARMMNEVHGKLKFTGRYGSESIMLSDHAQAIRFGTVLYRPDLRPREVLTGCYL